VRSQHLARRFPLQPGARAWVGVRHVHPLPHPGLGFLVLDDDVEASRGSLRYAGELAAACQARVTLLVTGATGNGEAALGHRARERLGNGHAGLEVIALGEAEHEAVARKATSHAHDLVVLPRPHHATPSWTEKALRWSEHGVLVAPPAAHLPRRVLIGVAAGEPAKESVSFAGRLVRHTGASVRLLTVLPERSAILEESIERFQAAAIRSLSLFGVKAEGVVDGGPVRQGIVEQMRSGDHDLLVVGSSLAVAGGPPTLGDLVEGLLDDLPDLPVLILHPSGVE
jgi:nucleotide-binding universal stress UspA family protein